MAKNKKKTEDFTDINEKTNVSTAMGKPSSPSSSREELRHRYPKQNNRVSSQSALQRSASGPQKYTGSKQFSFHSPSSRRDSAHDVEYMEREPFIRRLLCFCCPGALRKRPFVPYWNQLFIWNTFEQDVPTRLGKIVNYVIIIAIFLSLIMFVLGTEPIIIGIPALDWFMFASEYIIAILFTVEYVLRMYSCVAEKKYGRYGSFFGRVRYSVTVWGIVDFLAVAPSLFTLNFIIIQCIVTQQCGSSQENGDLRNFFLLRMFRLLRLGKLERQFKSIEMFKSVVREKYQEITLAFISLLTCIVLVATLMYFAERDVQPDCFGSIVRSLYFVVIILSSVGLGDCTASTPLGGAITSVAAILSILSVAIPTSILGSALIEQMARRKREQQQLRLKVRTKLQGMLRSKITQRIQNTTPAAKQEEEAKNSDSEEMLTASADDASESSVNSGSDLTASDGGESGRKRNLTRQQSSESVVSYMSDAPDLPRLDSHHQSSRGFQDTSLASVGGGGGGGTVYNSAGGLIIACPFCQNSIDLNMRPKKSSVAMAPNQSDDALQTFREFDKKNEGVISISQFRSGMKKRGVDLSISDVRHMIREAGSRPDGGINLKLFRKIMHMGDDDSDDDDDDKLAEAIEDEGFNWGI